MLLQVRSRATYELVGESFLMLMVEPKSQGPNHRTRDDRLVTTPTVSCELRYDLYGNVQRHIIAADGTFSFEYTATIETAPNGPIPIGAREHAPREIPSDVMIYTLPSRYCQSDQLTRMSQGEFASLEPGGGRVQVIAVWVRRHVEYRYGTTDAMTSAFDTATERIGVCRDFAHLVIAFCRALGIPARYVSAYALGLEPPDFHGYVQVYLDKTWHNVDATFDGVRPSLVPIAVGRDAADVAMTTLWGPNTLKEQSVEVYEVPEGQS
jgi:transglutaminase-like putative cysteine protease